MVNYCTEAPFIQTLCPTLVLGRLHQPAHQPDEYLETRFIKPTRELITGLCITSAGIKTAPKSPLSCGLGIPSNMVMPP